MKLKPKMPCFLRFDIIGHVIKHFMELNNCFKYEYLQNGDAIIDVCRYVN
jgi:hypothetical protein